MLTISVKDTLKQKNKICKPFHTKIDGKCKIPKCEHNQRGTFKGKCVDCPEYKKGDWPSIYYHHYGKIVCKDPKCEDDHKILKNGKCEKCPVRLIVAPDKRSCISGKCEDR